MFNLAFLSAAHIHTKGYLEAIAKRDDCRTAAVWDDVADRGRQYAAQFAADFTADLNRLVARDDIHGFIICAENTRHLPLLRAAIPAGKPIFCEKPLATSSADAAEALQLVRRHGAPLVLGYFQPFTAAIRGAARLVADGAVGKVTHVRFRNSHHAAYGRWFDSPDLAWFTDATLAGGGAFLDLGTHAVHALRSLFGPVGRVFARVGNVSGIYPGVDDNGIALLQFDSGVLGTVEAAWVQTGGIGGLEITGSSGTICNHPAVSGLALTAPKQDPKPVAPADDKPRGIDRLVAALDGRLSAEEISADLAAAADAVAIVEACYRSSAAGQWAPVQRLG